MSAFLSKRALVAIALFLALLAPAAACFAASTARSAHACCAPRPNQHRETRSCCSNSAIPSAVVVAVHQQAAPVAILAEALAPMVTSSSHTPDHQPNSHPPGPPAQPSVLRL